MSSLNSIREGKGILTGERLLSFFFGMLFSALVFWTLQSPRPIHAIVPNPIEGSEFPAQKCLPYVSTWVARNEVWYDYRLPDEAQDAGYKIQAAQVAFGGDLISIRVSK
jgi:hypothetical protein